MTSKPLAFAFLAGLALAGCNTTRPELQPAPMPQSQPNGVTPQSFKLPEGSGCSGDVSRYRAVMDNDLATGHVSKSVYDQIQGEISNAAAACSAGRDAEGRSLVRASKTRHGYP